MMLYDNVLTKAMLSLERSWSNYCHFLLKSVGMKYQKSFTDIKIIIFINNSQNDVISLPCHAVKNYCHYMFIRSINGRAGSTIQDSRVHMEYTLLIMPVRVSQAVIDR